MKDEPHGSDIEHLRAKPTDIVERLRKTADHEWIGHKTWTMAALREAADVIERLQADLAQRDRELASILLQLEADLSAVDKP